MWGSWGKNTDEIAQLVTKAREVGEANHQFARGISEIAARTTMRFRRLFGAQEAEVERMSEDLDGFTRLNVRMLDGCEYAYEALAAEWVKAAPNFESFVKSGALDSALAAHLQEAAEKHAAAGQRPTLAVERVNAEVLYFLIDDGSGKFVADVLFKSREKHGRVRAVSAAHDREMADPADTQQPTATVDGPPAADVASNMGEASAAAEGKGYLDTSQVWTFEAERPSLNVYMRWTQNTFMRTKVGITTDEDEEPPVTWRVRDINHVVHDDEPPEIIDSSAEEFVRDSVGWVLRASVLMLGAVYILVGAMPNMRRPPGTPPGSPPVITPQPRKEAPPPSTNKWGDDVAPPDRS